PDQVTYWISRGRHLHSIPDIANVAAYRDQWRGWYRSLMPAWRKADGNVWPLLRESRPEETWPILMKSGPNGILVIFMALYWWSEAVGGESDDLESAFDDVAWV
ncbi:hypothetical protein SCHPADRAFT_801972, partial [Schizopora paradoxa]